MFDLTLARNMSLMLSGVVLLLAFSGIIWTHWQHRRRVNEHFHRSVLVEMAWSLTPVVMTLALVVVVFKDF